MEEPAEIFKIRQAIDDSKQIWKKELEIAQAEMNKRILIWRKVWSPGMKNPSKATSHE